VLCKFCYEISVKLSTLYIFLYVTEHMMQIRYISALQLGVFVRRCTVPRTIFMALITKMRLAY
jgi:hypothetical protein